MKKQVLVSAIAAAVAASAFAPAVNAAEVSASAGVSNFYLWRGLDLGAGSPAVSGDLSVSEGPFYGGVWTSSGDDSLGTEFDLYAGVGHSFGDVSVDLSYWTYVYPTTTGVDEDGAPIGDIGPGEAAELIGSVGYGPLAYSLYYDVSDDGSEDWTYMTLGGGYGDFGATLGYHNNTEYMHLDIGYSYNDSLGFTLTLPLTQDSDYLVDGEPQGDVTLDPMFNVSYSLPIDL